MQVFISYAREDEETARRIYQDLIQLGADPWLDQEAILPGQDWERAIKQAIRESSFFIALISKYSVGKRGYVQKELRTALDVLDEYPPDSIYVIPVRIDESEPQHDRLKMLQRVDLFPNYENALAKISAAMDLEEPPIESPPSNSDLVETGSDEGIPEEVVARIEENAANDHPDNYSTQRYVIKNQVEAWYQVQSFNPEGLPEEIVAQIVQRVRTEHPYDFSTQYFVARNQSDAWNQIESLEEENVPKETVMRIVKSASDNHHGDYSTQLYVIRNQLEAWKELNS